MSGYQVIESHGAPIKAWTKGVQLDKGAAEQLQNVARLPFIHSHVAVMPDVHWGMGATVGSVIPTAGAIIPAAVGVDIGCGMMAVKTSIRAEHLPDDLGGAQRHRGGGAARADRQRRPQRHRRPPGRAAGAGGAEVGRAGARLRGDRRA